MKKILLCSFIICFGQVTSESCQYVLVQDMPKISITKETEKIGLTWMSGEVWEQFLIEKFYNILKAKEGNIVVFDVGAQTGCFSLLSKFLPNSKWYSFEPIEEAAAELGKNLKLNNIDNVVVVQGAVSDSEGSLDLKLPIGHWGLSTLGAHPERFTDYVSRQVQLVVLDKFAEDNNIQKLDFMKIDVEGWELHVLKGAKSLIEQHKPVILMEFNETNLKQCDTAKEEVESFLTDLGYEWELVSTEDILCRPKL